MPYDSVCQEAQPWALGMLPPAVSQQPFGAGLTFIIPISQLRKPGLEEVKSVTQGFPGGKWKIWAWAQSMELRLSPLVEQRLRLRQSLCVVEVG